MPHNHLQIQKAKLVRVPIFIAITGLALAANTRNWFDAGAKTSKTESQQLEQRRPPEPPFAVDGTLPNT